MSDEIWKAVVGFEGLYEVSDRGRVRSVDRLVTLINRFGRRERRRYRGKILRPGRVRSGHVTVALGKGNTRSVHTLVLTAFAGPAPTGYEALHGDGDPANNCLANLRWGTRSQNLIDVFYQKGRQLNRDQVLYVRQRDSEGWLYGERYRLALTWGVNPGIIHNIVDGRAYDHVR